MILMKIIRKTTVKQVITDQSREKLIAYFENKIIETKKQLDQLQYEKKKLLFQKKFDRNKLENRFRIEEMKREQNIDWYEFQLEQIKQLPNGSEIFEREVDEIIEVSIGSKWDEIAEDRTIIVKDGIIVEIK